MRRLWQFAAGALVLCCAAVPSFGAFASVAKSTMTAQISFTGLGTTSFSFELRNISGNTAAQSISWSGVTLNSTKWKAADQYILLNATLTNATGGIQIYTDNKGAGASPAYTGVGNPAGLVGVATAANPEISSTTLPMCWRVVDTSTTTLNIVQGSDNKLYSTQLGGEAGQFPCFAWMKDLNTPNIPSDSTTAFVPGEDYVTVKDATRGIHYAEGSNVGQSWGSSASPDYIYIGAKFENALGVTYRTTKLCLEAYTD